MITVEQMQTALAEATAKVNEANAKTDALILQVDKNTAETQLMVDIVATLKDQLATAQLTLPNEISDSFIALTESVARLSLANQSVADKLAIQDAIVQD